ncbi:hypothetical protein HUG10_16215 [Halorarum halophilum]|uniref:Uncharacterized protein n=1 Tax=Halorarum halophilum TaxID=2743090 RepID=A0A7D5GDJ9_9EURY|nr:hypothetical protein [Halobaculum halophilum]QLG28985.1 hypothetical protein HUG10_16215 [Halobaculum halophilum]
MGHELDDVDRSIPYLFQRNARDTTAQEIGDSALVSVLDVRRRVSVPLD